MSSALPNPMTNGAAATGAGEGSLLLAALNDTAMALGGTALEELKRRATPKSEWTGIGMQWMRSWLGSQEWRVPCLDVNIRL